MADNKKNNLDKQAGLKVIFFVIISITAGFFGGWFGGKNGTLLSSLNTKSTQQIAINESQLINNIADKVGPSVVSVNVTGTTSVNSVFGARLLQQQSAGTGLIIDSSGVIITNRHVVPKGTTKISVTLSDGTLLDNVSLIGRTTLNDSLDLAFLKVNNSKGKYLKAATLGSSDRVKVGDKVVAIGNALGQLQNTVTSGIISGYGRHVQASVQSSSSVENLQNLFQTDAAINKGNSGGPLVNINGQVIGINTAIAGAGAQNIGFAIPINDTKSLIKSVLNKGKLLRPYLGVRYVSLTEEIAKQYKLSEKSGAYIVSSRRGGKPSILAGSPAQKADLRERDIILKVNDSEISELNTLTTAIGRYSVGDRIVLTIVRGGKTQNISVTLEAAPNG